MNEHPRHLFGEIWYTLNYALSIVHACFDVDEYLLSSTEPKMVIVIKNPQSKKVQLNIFKIAMNN